MTSQQLLFQGFCKEIVLDGNDTKCERWENIMLKVGAKIVDFKNEMKFTDPKKFMKFPGPNCDVVKRLEALENACYSLSQYALNLCREPARAEYTLLKTYTGYYTANILSVMGEGDRGILETMGYRVSVNCENDDEFVLGQQINVQQINELAFELFVCQAYYRKLKQLCEEAMSKRYDSRVIISMLESQDIADIVGFGVLDICEKMKTELRNKESRNDAMKHTDRNIAHERPNPSQRPAVAVDALRNHDNYSAHGNRGTHEYGGVDRVFNVQVEDDDLYGDDPGVDPGSDKNYPEEATVYNDAYLAKQRLPEVRTLSRTQSVESNRNQYSQHGIDENRSSAVTGVSYAQKAAGLHQHQRNSLSDQIQKGASSGNDVKDEGYATTRMYPDLSGLNPSSNSSRAAVSISVTSTTRAQTVRPIVSSNAKNIQQYENYKPNFSDKEPGSRPPEVHSAPSKTNRGGEGNVTERVPLSERNRAGHDVRDGMYNREYVTQQRSSDHNTNLDNLGEPRYVRMDEFAKQPDLKANTAGNTYEDITFHTISVNKQVPNINTDIRNPGSGNNSPADENKTSAPFTPRATPSLYSSNKDV